MSNMRSFQATVFECYYEDNYEEGEVNGTFDIVQIASGVYPSVYEAVKDFIDKYHGSEFSKPEVVDDQVVAFSAMKKEAKEDRYANWANPRETDITAWKEGKINLWNVEYQCRIKEIVDVPAEDLDVALAKLNGKEEKANA